MNLDLEASTSPLYPSITPHKRGMLDVGDGYVMYWESSGNQNGIPAVFLHGGPGSGSSPWFRQFFDPKKYRIILFDQRGAGKSRPHASLDNNTTQHLISDMELLRQELRIDKWVVGGGSWGSTLSLAYADIHADKIIAMVMYGVFLARDSELYDMYCPGGAVSRFFPDFFAPYINLLPEEEKNDPIKGYGELFLSPIKKTRLKALDQWTRLEKRVSQLVISKEELNAQMANPKFVLAHSILENWYFQNNGFIDGDALLKRIGAKLKGIPVHIGCGRYDMVCPPITAFEIHQAIPHSQLTVIEDVGHSAQEPKVQRYFRNTLDISIVG